MGVVSQPQGPGGGGGARLSPVKKQRGSLWTLLLSVSPARHGGAHLRSHCSEAGSEYKFKTSPGCIVRSFLTFAQNKLS